MLTSSQGAHNSVFSKGTKSKLGEMRKMSPAIILKRDSHCAGYKSDIFIYLKSSNNFNFNFNFNINYILHTTAIYNKIILILIFY